MTMIHIRIVHGIIIDMELPVNYNELTFSERKLVREEYIKLQGNKCCFCGNYLDRPASADVRSRSVDPTLFPPKFFDWPVHLHHNHETGMTKGAVHCYCNAVLWQYYGE